MEETKSCPELPCVDQTRVSVREALVTDKTKTKMAENGHSVCISQNVINPEDTSISTDSGADETPERGQWTGQLDFLISVVNYAVGLGNVWRFPYLCYENGGGAFLFPYLVCLLLLAAPSFVMEVSIGQYLSLGCIGIWKIVPIFKGIGYASMTIVALYNIYFIVIVAWVVFYFVSSFTSILPWQRCDGFWNTELCSPLEHLHNVTAMMNVTKKNFTSPVVEFWERRVLDITDGIHVLGGVRWELALYLLLAWILVYFVIWKGLHQSRKVIWFTALFPYVILAVLLFRGVTLEGSLQGILFFITPDWSKLTDPKVWVAAGTQVFFTFGIGFGSIINLGSYNKYNHNFFRDSVILCIVNPATSILAGVVIFSVLGYMAGVQNIEVADAVKSGPGLAFLTYPEVVVHLPLSPVWSVLFFMMLFILGINSQFCTLEGLVSGIVDDWPDALRKHRKLFALVVCMVMFLLGLPMVTQGGMYIFQLMDYYAASGIPLLFTVFFQGIAIAWIYGTRRLSKNIADMIGLTPNIYFKFGWIVMIPLVTAGIFLFSVIDYEPIVYAKIYSYPWWGQLMGWGMALASMMWIPLYVVYFLLTTKGTLKERIKIGVTPLLERTHEKQPEEEESVPLDERNTADVKFHSV